MQHVKIVERRRISGPRRLFEEGRHLFLVIILRIGNLRIEENGVIIPRNRIIRSRPPNGIANRAGRQFIENPQSSCSSRLAIDLHQEVQTSVLPFTPAGENAQTVRIRFLLLSNIAVVTPTVTIVKRIKEGKEGKRGKEKTEKSSSKSFYVGQRLSEGMGYIDDPGEVAGDCVTSEIQQESNRVIQYLRSRIHNHTTSISLFTLF